MLPIITTKRLVLRSPVANDLMALNHYASKPTIGPNAGWLPHQTLSESRLILNMFIREDNVWAITIKPHDVMVGTIGLHNPVDDSVDGKGATIGYVLDDAYWNQGLMTEAVLAVVRHLFLNERLDFIDVEHAVFNTASQKVIEKTGFIYRYMTQKTYLENPEIIDIKVYRLTRKEWETQ